MAKAKKETLKKGNAPKRMNEDDEKTMVDLIVWLFEGYKKFGDNKKTRSILNIAVRYTTAKIGECKHLKISEKAEALLGKENCKDLNAIKKTLKDHPDKKTIKDHIITVKEFCGEFKSKKEKGEDFTEDDAKRWLEEATLVIITKEEDDEITQKGWRTNDHEKAYEQLGIKFTDVGK
jgi:hypothetical protein